MTVVMLSTGSHQVVDEKRMCFNHVEDRTSSAPPPWDGTGKREVNILLQRGCSVNEMRS